MTASRQCLRPAQRPLFCVMLDPRQSHAERRPPGLRSPPQRKPFFLTAALKTATPIAVIEALRSDVLHMKVVINPRPCYTGGMVDPDNKLILKSLKNFQDGVAKIRNGQTDLRRDMREMQATTAKAFNTLNASTATLLGLLGELVKAEGRDNERFASIEALLFTLEQRVVEQDTAIDLAHWRLRESASGRRSPPDDVSRLKSHPFLASNQGLLRTEAAVGEKARAVVGDELIHEPRAQIFATEVVEIEIEVVMHRHEFADVDVSMAFAQLVAARRRQHHRRGRQ